MDNKLINDILMFIHYIPQTIIITLFLAITIIFFKENKNDSVKKIKEFIRTESGIFIFLMYAAFLFTCAVLGRPYTYPLTDIIGPFGFTYNDQFNYTGLENIIIFVPYIILYLHAFKPHKPGQQCLKLTVFTTISIEIIQLICCLGQFCIADLIHNTVGGMIGYGIWKLVNGFKK